MPEQKYRERRASVCAYLCNSTVCLETLTFHLTIALQRRVLIPGIGLSRPGEQEHYTKNNRERTRSLRPISPYFCSPSTATAISSGQSDRVFEI